MMALAVVVSGCGQMVSPTPTGSGEPPTPTASTPTASTPAPDAQVTIRTFPVGPGSCDSIGVDDPVYGRLDGSAAELEDPVWLVAADGTRMSIIWPTGFVAQFDPDLTLRTDAGQLIGKQGAAVMFQVSRADAKGTFGDPYYASGSLVAGEFPQGDWPAEPEFAGCYPFMLGKGSAEWWIDPAVLPLPANTELVHGFVRELSCASGRSAADRVLNPLVTYRPDAIYVAYAVLRRPGPQTCEPNPAFPVEFLLGESVGDRLLFDAGTSPPRNASTLP
jgi:hypothetical protein